MAKPAKPAKPGEPFFFYMALVLLAVVVSGFSLAGFSKAGGPLSVPVFLHFHGAVCLGWFILLAVQARLASSGHIWLHKRLGQLSLILAAAIVLIGYLVVAQAITKPGMMIAGRPAVFGAVFPIFDIINFSIVYTLGLLNRGNAAAHKRLMLLGAIMMIDPAMARLILGLGLPGTLILLCEFAIYAALIAYDLVRLRRPHWASLLGLCLFTGALTFKMFVDSFEWWPSLISAVF